jgi:cobalamin biosynthesis Mg chelatase CobN
MSSDDSTARIGAGASDFTWLSTGPRNPPDGAHSARLRVMLSSQGGEAVVYLDDFSLTTGSLVAATASPTPAPPATQTARAVEATRDARSSNSEAASTTPPPGSTAQVSGARATATAKASQTAAVAGRGGAALISERSGAGNVTEEANAAGLQQPAQKEAPLWPYFALPGVGLLVLAGLLYGRRREAI